MSVPRNKEVNWSRLSSGLIDFLQTGVREGLFDRGNSLLRHGMNRTGIIERFGGFMWRSVIEHN